MISYGPFRNSVEAKNGINALIRKKFGFARTTKMGIVWQEGDACTMLQPALPHPSGYSEMMVEEVGHARKTPSIGSMA